MSPQVVKLIKCLPIDSINILIFSLRHTDLSMLLCPKSKVNGLWHHMQLFTHSLREREGETPLPEVCSGLDTSVKHLWALNGGLKVFFFIPEGEEALLPGAGLLCSLINQAL